MLLILQISRNSPTIEGGDAVQAMIVSSSSILNLQKPHLGGMQSHGLSDSGDGAISARAAVAMT